jgi:hypothetical protein
MPGGATPHTPIAEPMGLFDFLKYDKDDPGVQPSPELAAELRRIANLFLVSAITLILFLLEAFAKTLSVTLIPRPVYVVWGVALLTGIAVTYVYALYVTSKARRWGWVAACAIPFLSVPCAVAYAWSRRQEIERAAFGEQRPQTRQRRGGRGSRR